MCERLDQMRHHHFEAFALWCIQAAVVWLSVFVLLVFAPAWVRALSIPAGLLVTYALFLFWEWEASS